MSTDLAYLSEKSMVLANWITEHFTIFVRNGVSVVFIEMYTSGATISNLFGTTGAVMQQFVLLKIKFHLWSLVL